MGKNKKWKELRATNVVLKRHPSRGLTKKSVDRIRRGTMASKRKDKFAAYLVYGIKKDLSSEEVISHFNLTPEYFDDQMAKLLAYFWEFPTRRKYAQQIWKHYFIRHHPKISYGTTLNQSPKRLLKQLKEHQNRYSLPPGVLYLREMEGRGDNKKDLEYVKKKKLKTKEIIESIDNNETLSTILRWP